jgi:hypothetical protein
VNPVDEHVWDVVDRHDGDRVVDTLGCASARELCDELNVLLPRKGVVVRERKRA